jgi:aminoglycoside phosphotransferase (APT) family kinase protein
MKSITKNQINNETIEAMVQFNFGETAVAADITELGGGLFNSAYSFTLHVPSQEAERLVLKVAVAPSTRTLSYEKDIMRMEVALYQKLAGIVPTPKLRGVDFSRTVIDCDYFFMERMSGSPWNTIAKKISEENKEALKQEYGSYLALIHQIDGEYFGYCKNSEYEFTTWSAAFQKMVDEILLDASQGGVRFPDAKIKKVLAPHIHLLDEIKTPKLVHSDLWAGNIFLRKENNIFRIEGLIDHERAFWGDPVADYTASFGIYADIRKERSVQKGIEKIQGYPFILTKNDEIRMSMYRLYGALILGAETYRYSKSFGYFQLIYSKFMLRKYIRQLEKAAKK